MRSGDIKPPESEHTLPPRPEGAEKTLGFWVWIHRRVIDILWDGAGDEEMKRSISGEDTYFRSLPRRWRSDKNTALEAVKKDGWNLQFTSGKLRADREVALAAVSSYGLALRWVSRRLRNDRELALLAVKNCGVALKFASKRLRADRLIAFEAVRQDGRAYWYVDESLKNDQELIFASGINFVERKMGRY